MDRDAAVLVVGRSSHHRGTTHEKSLDCLKCGVGTARRPEGPSCDVSLCESIQVNDNCDKF